MSVLQRVTIRGSLLVLTLALAALQLASGGPVEAQANNSASNSSGVVVKMKVKSVGIDRLALQVAFFNPHRRAWSGHLFLEREDPSGDVVTLARLYNAMLPAGDRMNGTFLLVRPPIGKTHIFVARAYKPNGTDHETYVTLLDDEPPGDEVPPGEEEPRIVRGDEVVNVRFDIVEGNRPDRPGDDIPCDDNIRPISVELRLDPGDRVMRVQGHFTNEGRPLWRGDVYLDVADPDGDLQIVRRDLGVRIRSGTGFSTLDRVQRPNRPGVYRFSARALSRDGSAEVRWKEP